MDIENRAARRDREAKRRVGFGLPAGRVRDLTRFFCFTYGGALPDDDAGRECFFVLACHVARLNGDPERNVRRYAETWCPWMPADELDVIVRRVLAKPYRWAAATLGAEIGLLDEVRTRLRITTIRPIGVTLDQLNELHAAALAGTLLRPWFPVSWTRRLIMAAIFLFGLQQAATGNYQPLVWWLLLPFFSPRIMGEAAFLLGKCARVIRDALS